MKTAIIYTSNHGTTESVAQCIANGLLDMDVSLINLKKDKIPSLDVFEQIILGASIHAGNIQSRMKKFMASQMVTLLEKRIGLFLCCMDEKQAENQFNNAFPQLLRNHAIASACPGGEFNFNRMNFIEKAIVKKVSGIDHSVSTINHQKIDAFIERMLQVNE